MYVQPLRCVISEWGLKLSLKYIDFKTNKIDKEILYFMLFYMNHTHCMSSPRTCPGTVFFVFITVIIISSNGIIIVIIGSNAIAIDITIFISPWR